MNKILIKLKKFTILKVEDKKNFGCNECLMKVKSTLNIPSKIRL
jgi:hypothetical protein